MRPKTYSYPNDTYRGYITTYKENVMTPILCHIVRKNRLQALSDAKKKLKELRN